MTSKKILKSCPIPQKPATPPGEITLREWCEGKEWATHFHNLEDGGYYYGHYFTNLEEAEADFQEQVKKFSGTDTHE